MKVAFNARCLRAPTLRGWNRYTINLLSALSSLGVNIFLYSDQPLCDEHLARLLEGSYQLRVAPPMKYLVWEQHWVPRQCKVDGVDLLHTPINFGLPWSSPCPSVLTLHDAIDQVYCSDMSWYQKVRRVSSLSNLYHWVARHRAHHIITVSNHAKGDLTTHLGIPAEKLTVIYEAPDPHFCTEITEVERDLVRQQHGLMSPYVFYVGGWEQRKNISFLMQGFASAQLRDVELVLVGGNDEQKKTLQSLALDLGILDRVRLLKQIEDSELRALYAEALCFVYPSKYEGFGLQLCEAMAVGCPTLAARATSLPEVLGNGGETFSLSGTTELSALLQRLSFSAVYRAELRTRAKERASQFSWHQTAVQTLSVYQQVLGKCYSGFRLNE